VSGIEVTLVEVVAHPSDLAQWDSWLSVEKVGRHGLDSFAYLEQSDSHGIEYKTVR
jgi:hypothetical protein